MLCFSSNVSLWMVIMVAFLALVACIELGDGDIDLGLGLAGRDDEEVFAFGAAVAAIHQLLPHDHDVVVAKIRSPATVFANREGEVFAGFRGVHVGLQSSCCSEPSTYALRMPLYSVLWK